MGQFSVEIYALPGSLLSGNQQLGHVSSIVPRGVACPAAAFEGRRSVRLAVNSASSTIPCRASSSLISRCSHYVCQIVVWRTNLEVTPCWAGMLRDAAQEKAEKDGEPGKWD